jgi:triosephosphate isomerase
MTTKFLIANWKANPTAPHEAARLLHATGKAVGKSRKVSVAVCPPSVYLETFWKIIQKEKLKLKLGAQDLFWEKNGPYTGQVTPEMLRHMGVSCCLVGHSERRAVGETDEQINKKIKAALTARITPILLVGEQEKNDAIRLDILVDQLTRDLEGIALEQADKILYCYEPVWAISSHSGGVADTPESALSAIAVMRDIIRRFFGMKGGSDTIKILYGGSVNEGNIAGFLKHPEISGAVVGGASLRAEEFNKMIEIAAKL